MSAPEAGNGLYGRRFFLRGVAGAGALTFASVVQSNPRREPWMRGVGDPVSGQSEISSFESHVQRGSFTVQPGTVGSGASRTPLQYLDGLLTPTRLHFERHHSGVPQIDPGQHRLYVHGLVKRALSFDLETLLRYPMVSRIQFLECSGNSAALTAPTAQDMDCAAIHGLVSVSEWGGVPLAVLLDEAGITPEGKWVVASGADAAVMHRSIPLKKILDDAIVAVYQNGERLMPANGYPMRLFLPGWEGNASVKWLRSIQVTDTPAMSRQETSKYSDLGTDGRAKLFTFAMAVKSVITSPSPGFKLQGPGLYPISGMAWSGGGKIRRVDVSADGGRTWTQALLDEHVLPKCVTRFRAAWQWDGAPANLLSRAIDETGAVQPTRTENMHGRAAGSFYHVNAIQAWHIDANGEATNVYV